MAKIITEFPSRLSPVRILATVLALTLSLGCEKNDTDTGDNGGSSANQGSQPNSNQPVTQQPDRSSELTLTEYNAIKEGMSYSAVCGILGGGPAINRSAGNDMILYVWTSKTGYTDVFIWFQHNVTVNNEPTQAWKSGDVQNQAGQTVHVVN